MNENNYNEKIKEKRTYINKRSSFSPNYFSPNAKVRILADYSFPENMKKKHFQKIFNNKTIKHSMDKKLCLSDQFLKNFLKTNSKANLQNKNQTSKRNSVSKSSFLTLVSLSALNSKRHSPRNYEKEEEDDDMDDEKKWSNLRRDLLFKIGDDEKYFKTNVNLLPYLPPKPTYKIHMNRIIHDSNFYNKNYMIEDYLENYSSNSSKIKNIILKNRFMNNIKFDLTKLKFNGGIRIFNGFKGTQYNIKG